MRRESGAPKGGALAAYGCGLVSLAALLVWQAGDLKLGVYVVGGFAAAVAVFFAVAWVVLRCSPASRVSPLRRAARRCATASPTCAATRAATRCRSRASRSGSPRCCCSPSRATTWSTPGGAARRPTRPTASCRRAARPAASRCRRSSPSSRMRGAGPLPDGARPPGRGERHAGERGRLRRGARASAWSSASSTSRTWTTLPAHNTRGRPGAGSTPGAQRALGRGGHRRAPGLEARRRAHLRRSAASASARASPRCASCAGTR